MVAESMTMISTGQRCASARLAALFPEAVGPARQSTGKAARMSLSAQEHAIQLPQRPLPPSGAAVIALVGAFRTFHLPQQCVHFIKRQPAVGAHGAVARHGG